MNRRTVWTLLMGPVILLAPAVQAATSGTIRGTVCEEPAFHSGHPGVSIFLTSSRSRTEFLRMGCSIAN